MKHIYPLAHEIQRYTTGQSIDLSDLYDALSYNSIDIIINEYASPEKMLTDMCEIEIEYPLPN